MLRIILLILVLCFRKQPAKKPSRSRQEVIIIEPDGTGRGTGTGTGTGSYDLKCTIIVRSNLKWCLALNLYVLAHGN